MPYMFPLAPCTVHTFVWEDGERDTCYRYGSARPPANKKDRGAPSRAATANETNPQKERDSMSKPTFQPGELVRNTKTGELYRIATTAQKPGYVGYVRVTPKVEYIRPRFIEPLYSFQPDAQPEAKLSELTAELIRRDVSAKTTAATLAVWCTELDVDPGAILHAYQSLGFCTQDGANDE